MPHCRCDVLNSDVRFTCPIRALQSYNGALLEYKMTICGRERTSGETAAPPTCGERDILGTIKWYRHSPNRASTFKLLRRSVPADGTPNLTRFSTVKLNYKWKIIGLG
ncbi:hypothetical protein AVEN_48149-1 [Araneus ventricosus]|uniref:Uncharacterized protein n=1 Tax=Araneus ventricosus TaxID=182803 RepID=A0A4Y2FA86_ARAVE|nr:hypothetical protein AVEN_48149-1 [Araneus ventricosus]